MKKWALIVAFGLVMLGSGALVYRAFAVNANPVVGSVWTWLGPTFGADWVSPVPSGGGGGTCKSIEAFGGKGDDATDNGPAFEAAKAQTNCIAFPAGVFRFNSAIIYTFAANLQSLTILGAGQDVTTLHFPGPVNIALTLNMAGLSDSIHLRDFTMTTGTTNIDTAIYVAQTKVQVTPRHASGYANSDITRVTLRSDEGYWEQDAGVVSHGWKLGINTVGVSVVNFVEFTFYGPKPATGGYANSGGNGGTGIRIEGASPGTWLPVLFNLERVNINLAEFGIVYGNWTQGLQIVGSNITNCYVGIWVPPGQVDLAQLAIQSSQFNNVKNLVVESQVPQMTLIGNLLYTPSDQASVTLTAPSWMTQITGNSFAALTAHSGTGLLITPPVSDPSPPVISGNSFWFLATAINIGTNENGALITSNIYRNNTTNILNASRSVFNMVTGGVPQPDWAGSLPTYQFIAGAVDNGAGLVRVTVSSTTGFFNGQLVLVGGIFGLGGIDQNRFVITTINVIDATHLDLNNILFVGSYTSGGIISSVPL